jgi:hypothetical protein
LGTWPRPRLWFKKRPFEKQWLVIDREGGMLFVASSELAWTPVVDAEGYSLVMKGKKNKPPTIDRLDDLHLWPAAWTDVGGCL